MAEVKFLVKRGDYDIDAMFPQKLDGEIDFLSCDEGTADLLYGFVRALRPDAVLETGTHKGRSTQAIASALVANDHGYMITIDKDDYKTLPIALSKDEQARVKAVVGETPHVFNNTSWFKDAKIGFAFLDGAHDWATVSEEIDFVRSNMGDECLVAIDNTRDEGWPQLREGMDRYTIDDNISLNTCCGIDLIWLRSTDAQDVASA